ncbi:uncharacterized protein BDV17DRAFT_289002 [Aspergillus undulatus]|uniref:uncharacterized protein n=1 Tax=Aspergillus undulatus TaxID=1810928 RepID=UPI003CCD33E3
MEDLPLVDRSLAIFVVSAVMVGLSIIAVSMRCFVRLHIVRAFGWDDALMLMALALFMALSALCMMGSYAGVGHKMADFPNLRSLQQALKLWWLGQMLYLWASAVSKVAIALALLRLAVRRHHRFILWAICVVIVVIGMVFWLVLLFDCQPVEYFWERTNIFKTGKCLSTDILLIIAYTYSSLTIVCDVTLGILPVFLVWPLQMTRRTKLALMGILSLGAVASIAVVIRLPYLKYYSDVDFLYSTYQIAIWSVIETGLAIIAGSLITLRPLFRWFLDNNSSYRNRRRAQGGKHALSTLTANASNPGYEDPKHWRPDLEDNSTNTVITSVSSPGAPPLARSRQESIPVSPILPPPQRRKDSVTVEQSFKMSDQTVQQAEPGYDRGFTDGYVAAFNARYGGFQFDLN